MKTDLWPFFVGFGVGTLIVYLLDIFDEHMQMKYRSHKHRSKR